eukprot:372607-Rhodomonas_salina.2
MAVSEVHDTVWHAVLKASEPSYDAFRLAECRTLFALGGSPANASMSATHRSSRARHYITHCVAIGHEPLPGLPQPVELHSSRSASKLHRVVHWNVPNISPRNVAVVPPLVGLAAREIDDTLGASNVKALGSTSTCPRATDSQCVSHMLPPLQHSFAAATAQIKHRQIPARL